MKPRVLLLCCAALVVLSAGYPGLSARATAQVPGEVPSFLADYVDAVRVGDWFLACVEATAPEERFQSATRNTPAPWVLLDERGDVLAEDLYWRPIPTSGFCWTGCNPTRAGDLRQRQASRYSQKKLKAETVLRKGTAA